MGQSPFFHLGNFGTVPFFPFYIKTEKIPTIPKIIKIVLEIISIVFDETFLLIIFPKNIAIESLITIPNIEPKISENRYNGYWIPSPNEARKVLSPSSPIAMVKATNNIYSI